MTMPVQPAFNRNMGCIEIVIAPNRCFDTSSLIETWDVLKQVNWIDKAEEKRRLIETWDVLKLELFQQKHCVSLCLIETWDVLKCMSRYYNVGGQNMFNRNMGCIEILLLDIWQRMLTSV